MLSRHTGKKLNTYIKDYVIFDLETTGISCNNDEVVEISAIKVVDGEIIDEFTSLVNPGMPIPFYASEVNGITDDMIKNSPRFEEVFADFIEFVGDFVLVGHNIHTFDMKFLYRDAERFWEKMLNNDYIDTLQIARAYLPQLNHHRLTDLAEYYDIETEGAHRALNDCRMNQKVFECLHKEMEDPSDEYKKAKKCPLCGNLLKRRNGKFGAFWGCTSYPDCKYTEDI